MGNDRVRPWATPYRFQGFAGLQTFSKGPKGGVENLEINLRYADLKVRDLSSS